ncbi:hypothetical protein JD844_027804, partial [Phrynosoma platyrhinos]
CATAYILLAEEEATTIVEAEKLFKQALKAGEGCYRRSQQLQHHGAQYEAQHSKSLFFLCLLAANEEFVEAQFSQNVASNITEVADKDDSVTVVSGSVILDKKLKTGRDTNVLVYIKRRLAMCARKLGRTREAVKMMRDVSLDLC